MGYKYKRVYIYLIMKIIITIKDKNLDKTVNDILMIGSMLEKKFKGFKIGRCKCMSDGTSLILEK